MWRHFLDRSKILSVKKTTLAGFVAQFPVKKLKTGQVLLNAGETPKTLYYLKDGFVKRHINSLDGKELTVHIFTPGSLFPLLWALDGSSVDFNLTSLGSSKVALVPKEDFLKYIISNQDELLKITKRLLRGLEGMAKRVEILSFEKADSRVYSALLYLEGHLGSKLSFTHEGLSELTGLSRERVSIEMKKLRTEGITSYRRGLITMKKTQGSRL